MRLTGHPFNLIARQQIATLETRIQHGPAPQTRTPRIAMYLSRTTCHLPPITVDRIRFAVSPHLAFERPQIAAAWLGAIERSDGCTTRF
jgi:hypothetical protein